MSNAAPYRICLMHPMDPRGSKLGGIETHVRQVLSRHPADFSVLFVGVDEYGDCKLGEVVRVDMGERTIDFLPVAHIGGARINLASHKLTQSTTFLFGVGAARHLGRIRKAIGAGPASADLQRFEFAILPKLLGLKTVQMVHGEGSKEQKMDSLIKKLWFVHRLNEWVSLHLANKIFCVNPNIVKRLESIMPGVVPKAEVMTVSVDMRRFDLRPFDCADGVFRVVFAGRLDEFKDPPLMFRVFKRLHERLGGKFEFHYVGTSDPHRYAEFAAIEAFTVRHGFQTADGVSSIAASCHAGVLTSFFEGMPCYLLETLSVGRPFCAIRLPQYDELVVEGVSGSLIERTDPVAQCETELVEAFAKLWDDIRAGRVDPRKVRARVEPYSLENQMARLFEQHRHLQGLGRPTPSPMVEAPREAAA